jgi:hypothetical protein
MSCHGPTCCAITCPAQRVVPPSSNVPIASTEMHSGEDRSQPAFDSNFLHEIQLRTARPEQFRPGDIDQFRSLLNLIKLKHIFSLTLNDQTNPTLTKPEEQILTYGYHKKYKYPDPDQPSKSARIEWFLSTFDDASTSCDNASTCHNAFPLLAVILVHKRCTDTLSTIIALPSDYLQEFRAFIRQLPRSRFVEIYLEKISFKTPEGTPHPNN